MTYDNTTLLLVTKDETAYFRITFTSTKISHINTDPVIPAPVQVYNVIADACCLQSKSSHPAEMTIF